MRVSKAPEVRRQEILETAMKLFTEKGYEATSMRDIAQACGVVAGLCYRYFDSKQKLFQEATEAYVEECCGLMRRTLGDETLSLSQKLDRLYGTMGEEADFRYHGFFHRAGNEDFHQQLSLRLCQRMAPLLREALAPYPGSLLDTLHDAGHNKKQTMALLLYQMRLQKLYDLLPVREEQL